MKNGFVNGIGAMSAEDRTAASDKRCLNEIGAMPAEERTAADEKGFVNGIERCRSRRGRQRLKMDL